MRIVLILFIILTELPIAQAWTELTGNIRGIVTNQESGQVIRGATIRLVLFNERKNKFEQKSFSQDAGEFLFDNIPPGLYDLECSAFGFKTTRLVGVQIREDRTKLAFFKMERGSAAEINEIFTYAALEAKQKATTETSTATQETLEDAPATIYVITAEDIEDNGYMSLNEILEDIPEFEIQYRNSPQNNNLVSARGVYGNDKLLILKDGHRFNSMVNTSYTLMENYGVRYAKRVEIILGPASALYGADAYMGVVNIITAKGDETQAAGITGSYGNYNTTHNAAYVGWGKGDVSFALEGGFYHTDGANINEVYSDEFRFYNRNYLTNGDVLTGVFQNSTQNLPIEPFSLSRSGAYLNGRFDYKKFNFNVSINRETHSSSAGVRGEFSPYWQSSRLGNSMLNINLHQDYVFKKNKKWSASTNFTSSIVRLVPGGNFVNSFSSYQKAYKTAIDLGGRLQQNVSYQIHKRHSITAGLAFQHSFTLPQTSDLPDDLGFVNALSRVSTVDLNVYYPGTNFVDNDGNSLKIYQTFHYLRRWVAAGFVEYRGNIADKLLITVGGRYDQIIDVSEYARTTPKPSVTYFNFSPRMGLVYKPTKNLRFKFFAGQGFLQPSPERKYRKYGTFRLASDQNSIEGTFWHTPNPTLAPEKVRTFELASNYSKGDFTIGVNGYFNTIINAIVSELFFSDQNNQRTFQGIPIQTEETNVNSPDPTFVYGGTLNAAYRLVFGKEEQLKIKLRGSYTYADGQVKWSDNLPYTAKHTAKLGVLIKFHNFSLNNRLLFRSESYSNRFVDNDGVIVQYESPAFFVWNAFARYKILNKKRFNLDVFVKATNVLNSKYYHVTDNSSIALGASPQDPIRIMGGVSVNFGRMK